MEPVRTTGVMVGSVGRRPSTPGLLGSVIVDALLERRQCIEAVILLIVCDGLIANLMLLA
jgi:hypothetical protein